MLQIVFFGTPGFAVPSLEAIHQSRHRVIGVVTQPDRPKGRGLEAAAPPIKEKAIELGIPILQPEDVGDRGFLERLLDMRGDCFVVVGFRILPREVFTMPVRGTVNLHASLLPKYRGAAPIQWTIIRGETETGVTTFFINEKVDTGDWILQRRIPIGKEETAGELHDRLSRLGAEVIVETLEAIESGEIKPVPQSGIPSKAPKIQPSDCLIQWDQPSELVVNRIRGLSPFPGAFTVWECRRLKILKAKAIADNSVQVRPPGTVLAVSSRRILVQTGSGSVELLELQPECKKRMHSAEFLCGHPLKANDRFGSELPDRDSGR